MNKTIALLVIGLIIVIACSVWIINEQSKETIIENDEDIYTTDDVSKKTLYFYKNTYVGYLADGLWHMPTDVSLKEIFSNKVYTVYTTNLAKKIAKKIEVNLKDEKGGFSFCDENGNLIDASERSEILYKYSDNNNRDLPVFTLPVKLPNDIGNYKTAFFEDTEKSSVTAVLDKSLFQKDVDENLVSFNGNYDVKFLKESEIDFIPEDVKLFLIDMFSENNIDNDLPHNPIKYFKYDFNNDETLDEIYYFNFNVTDSKLQRNRYFSVILSRINNKFNALYKNAILDDNTGDESVGMEKIDIHVADLNSDNRYEILYSVHYNSHSWNYLAFLKKDMFVNLYYKNFDYSINYMTDLFNYENVNESVFDDSIYRELLSYVNNYIENANSIAQENKNGNVYLYTSLSEISGDNTSYFYYGYFESEEEFSTLKRKVDDFMHSSYVHESTYEKLPVYSGIRQYNLKTSEEDQDFIVNAEGELLLITVSDDGTIVEQERLLPDET